MRTILLVAVFFGLGCQKQSALGPCLVPTSDFVSVFASPGADEAKFYAGNYKACKQRKYKKNPEALFSVGVSVLHGLGTQKDPMKAFLWFKAAADLGHRGAKRVLAEMFAHGVGVAKSEGIAAKYLAACEKG
jgi:TPR repeat protein